LIWRLFFCPVCIGLLAGCGGFRKQFSVAANIEKAVASATSLPYEKANCGFSLYVGVALCGVSQDGN
jgi:hypothetical protein